MEAIAATPSALEACVVGNRFWYWLCPDAPRSEPRLLLMPAHQDPHMEKLLKLAGQVRRSLGARVLLGMAAVSPSGKLWFSGPGLTRTALESVAAWAEANRSRWPILGRLRGTRFLNVGRDKVVRATYELEDREWNPLAPVPVPGSASHAAKLLDHWPPLAAGWFWMTSRGADGEAAFSLILKDEDPKAQKIDRFARGSRGKGAPVYGTLRRLSTGRVMLATPCDLGTAREAAIAVLAAHPQLSLLAHASLVQLKRDRVVGAVPVTPLQRLSRLGQVIDDLDRGETVYYWFTDEDVDGRAQLCLDTDRLQLLRTANQMRGPGRDVLGPIQRTSGGTLLFVARDEFPGFLAQVAHWVGVHHGACPQLRRLSGARLVVQDSNGQIVSRHKDDEAWQRSVQ